jgi:hypothetical protein
MTNSIFDEYLDNLILKLQEELPLSIVSIDYILYKIKEKVSSGVTTVQQTKIDFLIPQLIEVKEGGLKTDELNISTGTNQRKDLIIREDWRIEFHKQQMERINKKQELHKELKSERSEFNKREDGKNNRDRFR